jgi:hypothetical protein
VTEPTDRSLPTTGLAFTALMLVSGAVLAFLIKAYPAIGEKVPGVMLLLIIAFPFDLAVNMLAQRGAAQPLTMNWRFGGFFAGAVLQFVLTAYVFR